MRKTDKSSSYFASMVDYIPEALISTDNQYKVINWNASAERIYGWKADEVIGKPLNNVLRTNYQGTDQNEAARKVKETGNWSGEVTQLRKDGARIPVWSSVLVVKDEQGNLIGFIGINRDISDKKQFEAKLRESEERYQTLASISPVGIFRTDPNGATTYVNPKWCEISGLSSEEALGDGWFNAVHPDDKEKLSKGWQKSTQLQKISSADYRFVRPDETIAWVMGQAVPETNSENQIVGYVGTITDITERKRAEENLRESEEKVKAQVSFLDSVMEQSPFAMWISDKTGTVIRTNSALRKTLNLTDEQILGKYNVLKDDNLNEQGAMSQVMAVFKKQKPARFSIPWVGNKAGDGAFKDAHDLWIDVSIFPIVDGDGNLSNVVGQWIDISEQVRADEAIHRYNEQLSAVVDIEHALSTPLNQGLIYETLNKGIRRLFPDVSTIFLSSFDPEREMIKALYGYQDDEPVDVANLPELPLAPSGEGTQSRVIHTRQPLIINTDLKKKFRPGVARVHIGSDNKETQSALYVPMLAQDVVLGVIQLQSYSPNRFTEEDARSLALIANTAAVSIQNARLYELAQKELTERKRAEQSLYESQFILSMAEQVAQMGSWKWDLRTQKITWSDEMFRLFGVERDGFDGNLERVIAERIHRADIAAVQESNQKVLEDADPVPMSYRIVLPDGTERIVWAQGKLVRDEADQAVALVGYVQDVTERKQAEAALRESEQRFRHLFVASPDALMLIDPSDPNTDWPIVDCNEIACQMNGYTREELVGKSVDILNITKGTPQERAAYLERVKRAGVLHLESFHRHRDGHIYPIEISTSIVTSEARELVLGIDRDITERKLAEREIQYRTEDLLLINALNEAVNRGEDIAGIAETFAREAHRLFNCQDVTIYLLSPDKKSLEMQNITLSKNTVTKIETLIGRPIPKVQIPIREHGHFKKMLMNEGGSITNDPKVLQEWMEEFTDTPFLPQTLRAPIRKIIPRIYKLLNIHSTITIPLISSGQVIGLLDMASKGQFTDDDLQRIRNISRQMTAVILRKRAEQQVKLQLQRVRALSEIDRAITSSLDMRLSLDILLSEVLSQLEVDAVSVLLLDNYSHSLEYVAGKGFRTSHIRQSRMRLGEGVAGQVGLERKVLHIPDLVEAGVGFKRAELLRGEEFLEYFGVPLVAKGQLKGVLEIFHRSHLEPDLEWVNYLETLGGQAAIAIDSAQLFEGIQRSNMELITAYDATIAGWSRAMDLRDKETEGHTLRVTELTLKLAEKIGVSQQEQVHFRRGALLHDIGKLGVPDHILLKPGKLTDEEWVIMRQHPTYAFEMLMPIDYLRPALDIPYCHHEKWDGSGYPRGLKDEQIPLAARIFAVVDVWDALTSDRPYRLAWSREKTLEHIRSLAGTHFDSEVVDMFLSLIENEDF